VHARAQRNAGGNATGFQANGAGSRLVLFSKSRQRVIVGPRNAVPPLPSASGWTPARQAIAPVGPVATHPAHTSTTRWPSLRWRGSGVLAGHHGSRAVMALSTAGDAGTCAGKGGHADWYVCWENCLLCPMTAISALRCPSGKRIDDRHAIVGLPIIQVSAEERMATHLSGGGHNGGVPVGDAEALLCVDRVKD
jgi:hypothetical protein